MKDLEDMKAYEEKQRRMKREAQEINAKTWIEQSVLRQEADL